MFLFVEIIEDDVWNDGQFIGGRKRHDTVTANTTRWRGRAVLGGDFKLYFMYGNLPTLEDQCSKLLVDSADSCSSAM
jgi:hypothetical protein